MRGILAERHALTTTRDGNNYHSWSALISLQWPGYYSTLCKRVCVLCVSELCEPLLWSVLWEIDVERLKAVDLNWVAATQKWVTGLFWSNSAVCGRKLICHLVETRQMRQICQHGQIVGHALFIENHDQNYTSLKNMTCTTLNMHCSQDKHDLVMSRTCLVNDLILKPLKFRRFRL